MNKAIRLHPAFGNTGSTLCAALASIFVDAALKNKDDSFDLDELVGMTAAPNAEAVIEALRELAGQEIIRITVDNWDELGSIVPLGITINLAERQKALDMSAKSKAPQGRHDRSIGEDSVVIGSVEYCATVSPLPPEPGPYTLTVLSDDSDNPESGPILCIEFAGDGAEVVLEAWAFFDEWVEDRKQANSFTYWLDSMPMMADDSEGNPRPYYLLNPPTFHAAPALPYEDTFNDQLRTLADTDDGILVLALEGEAGLDWPGIVPLNEPENVDSDAPRKGRKSKVKDIAGV